MKNDHSEPWTREVLEHFERRIEHSDFGTLASRLERGQTQAQYLLHRKEADKLTKVQADRIHERYLAMVNPPEQPQPQAQPQNQTNTHRMSHQASRTR